MKQISALTPGTLNSLIKYHKMYFNTYETILCTTCPQRELPSLKQ